MLSIIIWIVCGLVTYLLVRYQHRKSIGPWTQWDRLFWISNGLLYGPIMLIAVVLIGLFLKLSSTGWAKREAQW